MTKRFAAASVAVLISALSACSVKVVDQPTSDPSVVNWCAADSDCMSGATCRSGACYAAESAIDEVVVEVVPPADSPSGGLAYVVMLENVGHGGTRDIALPAAAPFVMQVQLNAADAAACGYKSGGAVTLPARVEFTRIASVGGAPIIGLPSMPQVAVTTQNQAAWNYPMSLVPGSYDIYVQPTISTPCVLPPRLLRGQQVGGTVNGWEVPATLELPRAVSLTGLVQRRGGTLLGWKIDVVDAQAGRVISTSSPLGATDPGGTQPTNFSVQYQPVGVPKADTVGAVATLPTGTSALLRLVPPENMAAPTVFWDLAVADLNGDGKLNLDVSGIPTPDQLVHVEGGVQGLGTDANVPATITFSSTSLPTAKGLTATFTQTASTNAQGHFNVDLFAGEYRVIASPTAPAASAASGGPGHDAMQDMTSPWAVTESHAVIGSTTAPLSVLLSPKRLVTGVGLAGPDGDLALGATFDANPTLIAADVGVLRGVLAQSPVLPEGASVTVGDHAVFSVPLDPGTFDLWLRPQAGSNFAWWVAPSVTIPLPTGSEPLTISPRLPLPVAIEGVITPAFLSAQQGSTNVGLANASVQAYARAPTGSAVTKVAETRTDASGHYRLSLPATFGSL